MRNRVSRGCSRGFGAGAEAKSFSRSVSACCVVRVFRFGFDGIIRARRFVTPGSWVGTRQPPVGIKPQDGFLKEETRWALAPESPRKLPVPYRVHIGAATR